MPKSPKTAQSKKKMDLRKQLFNDGKIGKAEVIQISTERIVKLNGIMYDIDQCLYRKSELIPKVPADPERFYRLVLKEWLSNHPLLHCGEVRVTGTGLHVILKLAEPVVFENEADRLKWAAIVKVVQVALPIDPNQPGITATTRKLGSYNSKNGAKVVRLSPGEPVAIEGVLALFDQMRSSPFRTIVQILAGTDKLSPCPVCGGSDSTLNALDFVGNCYGSCGKVKLEQLWDSLFRLRPIKK